MTYEYNYDIYLYDVPILFFNNNVHLFIAEFIHH